MTAALFCIGCNPLTGAFFMMFGVDDKTPAEFRIAGDGKKTAHVLILTSMIQESRSELLGVERQLGAAINKQLEADCKLNKEKIKLVPVHKIEEFKNNNPSWRTMTATEIGRQFDVDYVVDVEVASLSLYEKDSRKRLYRGRGAITLAVIDVTKSADEGPAYQRRLSMEYPKARGPIPVDDEMTPDRFRELFIQRIARDVSWQLTSHVTTAGMMDD
jgi:hypothetical protein